MADPRFNINPHQETVDLKSKKTSKLFQIQAPSTNQTISGMVENRKLFKVFHVGLDLSKIEVSTFTPELRLANNRQLEIYLARQEDASQCGFCSVYNLLKLTGQSEIVFDPNNGLKLSAAKMRKELGYDEKTWIHDTKISKFLSKVGSTISNMGCGNKEMKYIGNEKEMIRAYIDGFKLSEFDGFIVSTNSHYKAIANVDSNFVLVDSLSGGNATLISDIEVKKILSDCTSYVGLKK
jgi:hypothetical protein